MRSQVSMRNASLSVVLTLMAACTSSQSEGPLDAVVDASLDAVLSRGVEKGAVAGVVGLVTGPDSILYRGAFGAMDASGQEPMREDAIFQIFSMTKPVTSVAAMMLVEQGMLGLDDDAASYLPEFADREVLTGINVDSSFTTRPASAFRAE